MTDTIPCQSRRKPLAGLTTLDEWNCSRRPEIVRLRELEQQLVSDGFLPCVAFMEVLALIVALSTEGLD